jgi:hypothetical protein
MVAVAGSLNAPLVLERKRPRKYRVAESAWALISELLKRDQRWEAAQAAGVS